MSYLRMFFKHWDRVNDISLRLIKQIPEGKLDLKATPENMTIRDLMSHTYQAEKVFAETAKTGETKLEDFKKYAPPEINTVDDLYNYAKEVHENTNRIVAEFSDDELLSKIIKTPWGEMPLFHHLNSAYEHLWHHRGQLYIYLRMAGVKDPVFVFDYEGLPQPA